MKQWSDEIKAHIDQWSNELNDRNWWPRYLYHFTDVQNAISIIQSGCLYSRNEAQNHGIDFFDCASPQVIEGTQPKHLDYVRLYFRPRTPTQFDNEGIRPLDSRAINSHCPIPVFFCFDAFELLSRDNTEFSDGNMGTKKVRYGRTLDLFKSIPFNKVFHTTWFTPEEKDEIIFHRNAEVLIPRVLELNSALKHIVFRSATEDQTLRTLASGHISNKWYKKFRLD